MAISHELPAISCQLLTTVHPPSVIRRVEKFISHGNLRKLRHFSCCLPWLLGHGLLGIALTSSPAVEFRHAAHRIHNAESQTNYGLRSHPANARSVVAPSTRSSLKAGEYCLRSRRHGRRSPPARAGVLYTHTVVIPEGYRCRRRPDDRASRLGSKREEVARGDTDLIHDPVPEATRRWRPFRIRTGEARTTNARHRDRHGAPLPPGGISIGLATDVHRSDDGFHRGERDAAPEERPLVASVYYSRLTKRMALDADQRDLCGTTENSYRGAPPGSQTQSPYNTYT